MIAFLVCALWVLVGYSIRGVMRERQNASDWLDGYCSGYEDACDEFAEEELRDKWEVSK